MSAEFRISGAAVLRQISLIRTRIREQRAFDLRCEVRYVSPSGEICPADQVADRLFPAD